MESDPSGLFCWIHIYITLSLAYMMSKSLSSHVHSIFQPKGFLYCKIMQHKESSDQSDLHIHHTLHWLSALNEHHFPSTGISQITLCCSQMLPSHSISKQTSFLLSGRLLVYALQIHGVLKYKHIQMSKNSRRGSQSDVILDHGQLKAKVVFRQNHPCFHPYSHQKKQFFFIASHDYVTLTFIMQRIIVCLDQDALIICSL